jgi:hypothetical protein
MWSSLGSAFLSTRQKLKDSLVKAALQGYIVLSSLFSHFGLSGDIRSPGAKAVSKRDTKRTLQCLVTMWQEGRDDQRGTAHRATGATTRSRFVFKS